MNCSNDTTRRIRTFSSSARGIMAAGQGRRAKARSRRFWQRDLRTITEKIMAKFLAHYLKDKPNPNLPEATDLQDRSQRMGASRCVAAETKCRWAAALFSRERTGFHSNRRRQRMADRRSTAMFRIPPIRFRIARARSGLDRDGRPGRSTISDLSIIAPTFSLGSDRAAHGGCYRFGKDHGQSFCFDNRHGQRLDR